MDKGEVLADMDLAKEIANDLANSRISKPVFPVDVWEVRLLLHIDQCLYMTLLENRPHCYVAVD